MAAWRSTTERNTPRLSRRRVSLAKKPSTALSYEAEAGVHLSLDGIEEANELLMAMALHVAADDGASEEGGEQRRVAVALVVVSHGAGAPLLHR